jgi:hypothetical protein
MPKQGKKGKRPVASVKGNAKKKLKGNVAGGSKLLHPQHNNGVATLQLKNYMYDPVIPELDCACHRLVATAPRALNIMGSHAHFKLSGRKSKAIFQFEVSGFSEAHAFKGHGTEHQRISTLARWLRRRATSSLLSARNTGNPTAGTIASRSSSDSTKTRRTCTCTGFSTPGRAPPRSTRQAAGCGRDFSLSGRVFGPLRERMATGVGEQLVSIPLIARAAPVTVDQVLCQYVANNEKAKTQRPRQRRLETPSARPPTAHPPTARPPTASSSSDSDSDGNSDSDSNNSSASGYDPKESPAETDRRLKLGKRKGHRGPLHHTPEKLDFDNIEVEMVWMRMHLQVFPGWISALQLLR